MFDLKNTFLGAIILLLAFSSCRQADEINEGEEFLQASSELAVLMERTSLNDGSTDNILDNANCFRIKLPVSVVVNGNTVMVNTEDDFDLIESIFDADDDDLDEIEFIYPITIITQSHQEIQVTSRNQLRNHIDACNGENEADDDIECVDFIYPVNVSVYSRVTEQYTFFTIQSDKDMHDFIEDIKDGDQVTIEFPVSLELSDGTVVTVNNQDELKNTIEDHQDDCDEDDDYDYNDDDCIDCTPQTATDFLTACSDWTVDKLELNDLDFEDDYIGFTFNFANDGTITVQDGITTYSGSYTTSEVNGTVIVTIEITLLLQFNASWELHEVENYGNDRKIDMRLGDNRLRFESNCN